MARKDVTGPNDTSGDVLHGGPGNDTFRVRDGEQDTVDCGPGVDTVYADFKDVLAQSGRVRGRQPGATRQEGRRHAGEPRTDGHVEPARLIRSGDG